MLPEPLLFTLIRISAVLVAWVTTYIVHSTILLAAAWLLTRTLAKSPAVRETIWKTAMLGGLATAAISIGANTPGLNNRYDASQIVEREVWKDAPLSRQATLDSGVTAKVFNARLSTASERIRLLPVAIVLLWSTYALLVLVRVLFATKRARAALGPRHETEDRSLRERFDSVRTRLGITQPVRLTLSQERSSPVALGANEICLPERLFSELEPEEQESVLAHEVAHLVRRDPTWLLATVTIEAILFFQPLNRLARMHIQEEAEYLSDDLAVEKGSTGVILARCLSRVADWMSSSNERLLAPGLVEAKSSLVPRVRRLLEEKRAQTKGSRTQRFAIATLLPLTVLIIAPAFTPGGSRVWGTPAFHWAGPVAAGKTIEIKGSMGSIRAEQWSGRNVEVNATRHGRSTVPDVQFAVVESTDGITICTVYPTPEGIDPNVCAPGREGREYNTKANDVEVEYLVRVPSGVRFAARSATGDVSASLLDAPIIARSLAGDIDVATTAHASAVTLAGNVTVRMGSTAWVDTLRIGSNSGNIDVTLPRNASTTIDADSRVGAVRSDFPLAGKHLSFFQRLRLHGSLGEYASGKIGNGGRALSLRTISGNIAIKRSR